MLFGLCFLGVTGVRQFEEVCLSLWRIIVLEVSLCLR